MLRMADLLRSKMPFLVCLKIMGFLPSRIANNKLEASSSLSRGYSALLIGVYLVMLIVETILLGTKIIINWHYFALTFGANLFRILGMLEIFLMAIFRETAVIEICAAYKKYDVIVKELKYPRIDNIDTWWILSLGLFSWQTFLHFANKVNVSWIFDRYSTFRMMTDIILKLYFYALFDLLQQRARHLNDVILSAKRRKSMKVVDKSPIIQIRSIRMLHRLLRKCAEKLDEHCARYLLYTLAEYLVFIIIQAHIFCRNLSNLSLDWVVHVLIGPFLLVLIVSVCDRTSSEINRTGSCMLRNAMINIDPNVTDGSIELALYLLHHKFHFSAIRWFSVDLSVVMGITSFVTTYVVLLLDVGVESSIDPRRKH